MKWDHHNPRGPRSCPSYAVSSRHYLVDPIRPTRGHIAFSPHGGLYAMPSLCGSAWATREWFRAFTAHSFLACRPLRPRGVRHRYPDIRRRHWPSPNDHRLGTPDTPAIRSARVSDFVASLVRFRYGLPDCSPPCTDPTGSPSEGSVFIPYPIFRKCPLASALPAPEQTDKVLRSPCRLKTG